MTVSDQHPPRLAALLSSASVEISSRGHQIAELRDNFAAGTDVTITFLPGDNYRHNVETATALRRAGFNPVPHIAAREMPRGKRSMISWRGRGARPTLRAFS